MIHTLFQSILALKVLSMTLSGVLDNSRSVARVSGVALPAS